MNAGLHNRLRFKIQSNDILSADFKDLDPNTGAGDLNFQKVRGSIRLLLKKVFTPKDTQQLKEKVLSLQFD